MADRQQLQAARYVTCIADAAEAMRQVIRHLHRAGAAAREMGVRDVDLFDSMIAGLNGLPEKIEGLIPDPAAVDEAAKRLADKGGVN